ncbi:MAG TPA: phytoene/squalene synthase family protein [Chitinophagales bacterium]|nr:phytoene/squalene synthase family protein [Chitinophagales bacterium]
MKSIFDDVSAACSRITTRSYSTSFSLGILFLDKPLQPPVYGIYGFVRFADEIVDTFHNYDKQHLFSKFKQDTLDALEHRISLNPILNSFQQTVHRYKIEQELIDCFLESMETDLNQTQHDVDSYRKYILGSAESVGLMCLRVFTDNNSDLYEAVKPNAMKLGAAFQKVNFLRDINADHEQLGRMYFPNVDFSNFTQQDKANIEEEIEADFNDALVGIKQLPSSSRRGVYLAYVYYKKLFAKIRRTPVEQVAQTRIRVANYEKMGLLCGSLLRNQFGAL